MGKEKVKDILKILCIECIIKEANKKPDLYYVFKKGSLEIWEKRQICEDCSKIKTCYMLSNNVNFKSE